jgi:hypothetical protein
VNIRNPPDEEPDTEADPERELRFRADGECEPVDAETDSDLDIRAPGTTDVAPTPAVSGRGALLDVWLTEKKAHQARNDRSAQAMPPDPRFIRVDLVRASPHSACSVRRIDERTVRLRGDPGAGAHLAVAFEGRVFRAAIPPATGWSEALRAWCAAAGVDLPLVVHRQSDDAVWVGWLSDRSPPPDPASCVSRG